MNKSRNKKAGYNSYQPEEIYLKNLSDPRRPIGLIALFTLCYFSFFFIFSLRARRTYCVLCGEGE